MSEILQITELEKSFSLDGNEFPVLRGINFKMKLGDFYALMGSSGSGKSTLLNIAGGLIGASSGSVFVNGEETTVLDDDNRAEFRRYSVGWIFQDFNLIDQLTAKENVIVAMNLAGKTGPSVERRAEALLDQVGLGDRMDHFPDELSGGQQQRVSIARALANDPPLILADEPTGNLDSRTGKEIIKLFKELATSGKAVLMVSHDIELAHAAHSVYILKNGVIHKEVEKEEI